MGLLLGLVNFSVELRGAPEFCPMYALLFREPKKGGGFGQKDVLR